MNNKVIIIGAFHEIIELAEDLHYEIVGLVDNIKTGCYYNYPILGTDNDIKNIYDLYHTVPLIITPDQPLIREKLFCEYHKQGFSFKKLISAKAKISKSAIIGTGTVVQAGVNISNESDIGRFVKLNTKCNIMHNVAINDFTTVAPNAVVLGHVKIGQYCYIGSNSTILPYINICDNIVIGAGAVVTKNITKSGTYVGNPARLFKE